MVLKVFYRRLLVCFMLKKGSVGRSDDFVMKFIWDVEIYIVKYGFN